MTRVTLVLGAGGVGKTTIAAGLGALAASQGLRTLTITVDPARRLAQALSLDLDHRPRPVDAAPGMDAAMLDSGVAWESIAFAHADEETAGRLIANPFFAAVAHRFPSGQAYAVADGLVRHVESGTYDLIVVDTPPAGGGSEFLESPRRIRSVIAGRALRVLTGAGIPGRRAIYRLTARPALRVADGILGGRLLRDLADFLVDLSALYSGMTRRSRLVEGTLQAASRVVVTTARAGPVAEARRLSDPTRDDDVVVFNRALPDGWADAAPNTESLALFGPEASRQREIRAAFAASWGNRVVAVPWLPAAPETVAELAELVSGAGLLAV